jgi:hypothetical protein
MNQTKQETQNQTRYILILPNPTEPKVDFYIDYTHHYNEVKICLDTIAFIVDEDETTIQFYHQTMTSPSSLVYNPSQPITNKTQTSYIMIHMIQHGNQRYIDYTIDYTKYRNHPDIQNAMNKIINMIEPLYTDDPPDTNTYFEDYIQDSPIESQYYFTRKRPSAFRPCPHTSHT